MTSETAGSSVFNCIKEERLRTDNKHMYFVLITDFIFIKHVVMLSVCMCLKHVVPVDSLVVFFGLVADATLFKLLLVVFHKPTH